MLLVVLTAIFACVSWAFYAYVKKCQSVFEKEGVPSIKPVFFFGNILQTVLGRKNLGIIITEVYKKFKNYKYVGFYKFIDKSIIIRDPDLIYEMLVKDFQHFSDNEVEVDEKVDFIMAKNIFVLKGHQWKTMRSLLTPMFSSGKLKNIFGLVDEVAQQFVKYIEAQIDAGNGKCMDGKATCTKFTINNVACCAFGLDGRAFEEGDSDFLRVVQGFADQSYTNSVKLLLIFIFPKLNKWLKIKFFKDSVEEYLTGVVRETMEYRRENNIVRNDFLDQFYALKEKSTEYPFTDRDVVAQGAGFFMDGVETSAGVMSYILYEIAKHPQVQKKLRAEIRKVLAKTANKSLTYECINEMNYLDCIVSETLRLDGPAMMLFKVCTKEYTLPKISDDCDTRLVHVGDSILIAIDGIQTDPAYFPEPQKFMPERFEDENKANIVKNTFMPFGNGPRMCIGQRFGLLQIKIGVIALINNFEIGVNEKMLPYEVHPTSLLKAPKKGFWFDFTKIPK